MPTANQLQLNITKHIVKKNKQTGHSLWSSASLKMPIFAHFLVVLGVVTTKVDQTDPTCNQSVQWLCFMPHWLTSRHTQMHR